MVSFLKLQGQKPTAVSKTAEAHLGLRLHFLPLKKRRLGPGGGMERRELREVGLS